MPGKRSAPNGAPRGFPPLGATPKWALILALVLLLATTALSRHKAKAAIDCSSVSEIPVAECQALVELYTSTSGLNWTDQENWLVTNTPCSWYGVRCESGEHVTSIDLYYNRLSGGIPAEIANLSSLQSLGLARNQLSSLPAEIGNLSSLEELDLVVNFSLAGPLPASLLQLNALWSFHFADTNLCEPGDAAFQAWLANIPELSRTNVPCGSLYMPLITTEQ